MRYLTPVLDAATDHALALRGRVDPGVRPNWTFFPFITWLQSAVGGVVATILVILVAVAVIGAVVWAGSKLSGAQRMQGVSGTVALYAFAAAVVVGSASAIVRWAAGQNLGF